MSAEIAALDLGICCDGFRNLDGPAGGMLSQPVKEVLDSQSCCLGRKHWGPKPGIQPKHQNQEEADMRIGRAKTAYLVGLSRLLGLHSAADKGHLWAAGQLLGDKCWAAVIDTWSDVQMHVRGVHREERRVFEC